MDNPYRDGGCCCAYLSERCGGWPVVCQHCHDVLKRELTAAKAEIARLTADLVSKKETP